jgi:penicillin-binding protein 1C
MAQKKVFSFIKTRIRQRIVTHKNDPKKPMGWKRLVVLLTGIFFSFLVLGFAFLGIATWILGSDLPDVHDLRNFITSESTVIYDREGNVLYTIHGEENRENVPLSEIPQYLVDATISIEDDQFYTHGGFDVGGIIKAGLYEVFKIGKPRGGSTITQQLVKNVFLTSERSYTRKLKELIMAMRLEQALTKDEILELYLNRIPYGSNAYGVQMAARTFFGKQAKDLTLLESSILASLPKAPSKFSPYGANRDLLMGYTNEEGEYLAGRKDVVLQRMVELGYITQQQSDEAHSVSVEFEFSQFREDIKYPHFVFYVRELLEKKFGDAAVEQGGLRVYTTINPNIQDVAEESIAARKERNQTAYDASNMALLSVDPTNGQILAMVGSADYFDDEIDGKVNVVTRLRSPGSSFKPIVYAAGFLNGFAPASVLFDVETDFGNDYKPKNFDGTFKGPVNVRTALGNSLNIPAVKMAFLAGVDNVLNLARSMGAESLQGDSELYGISIGLGTGEVPMIEMVKAYTVFARGGSKIDFNPFLRIEDSQGSVIEDFEKATVKSEDVLDPEVAYLVTNVLSDSSARPEWGGVLNIGTHPNAAKTGTSNKRIVKNGVDTVKPGDVWTIGYTTRVVTAVWAGNNNNDPMNNNASGAVVAAPVWNAVMKKAVENHPVESFPVPKGITEVEVAKYSGKLPSATTPSDQIVTDVFASFGVPTEEDDVYGTFVVDGVTRKLATEFTPESALVSATMLNFHSERPDFPNWEEPVQEWVKENFSDPNLLTQAPTEYDDVHTATTGSIVPSLQILSPTDGGIVGFGPVGVIVDIDSQRRIDRVDYFIDGTLVDSQLKSPYRSSFTLSQDEYPKGEHSLTAKVYDHLLYSASQTITLDLGGTDKQPPEIEFLYPRNNETLPVGSSLKLQVRAFDKQGDVKQVEYSFDGNRFATVTEAPFAFTYNFKEARGSHRLTAQAVDFAGNTSQTEITINLSDEFSFGAEGVSLLQPLEGDSFDSDATVIISGRASADMVGNIQKVEFTARKKLEGVSSARGSVGTIDGDETSSIFTVPWTGMTSGTYDITMKVFLKDGNSSTSPRARITIR